MPSTQNPQALPSIDLGPRPDHYRTTLPNLSYPFYPNSHSLCSGSSAPLRYSKTTRHEMPSATLIPATFTPNEEAPTTTNVSVDTCSVPDVFQGINELIWHNLSMIVRKLKLIWQKLFGFRSTSPSTTAGV